jgi:hypothetical protein
MKQIDRIMKKVERMTPWQCGDALCFAIGYGENSRAALKVIEAGIDFVNRPKKPTTLNSEPSPLTPNPYTLTPTPSPLTPKA